MTVLGSVIWNRRRGWADLFALALGAGVPVHAHAAAPAKATKAAPLRRSFPSPFVAGAEPLDDGPLVTLMGNNDHLDASQYADLSRAIRTLPWVATVAKPGA